MSPGVSTATRFEQHAYADRLRDPLNCRLGARFGPKNGSVAVAVAVVAIAVATIL